MGIKVAVLTEAGGSHLDAYFAALAATAEAESVLLGDASGASEALARKTLGNKLKQVYRDTDALLRAEKPRMALVSLEAVNSPRSSTRPWRPAATCLPKSRPACERRTLHGSCRSRTASTCT